MKRATPIECKVRGDDISWREMITEIGVSAGEIWKLLNEKGCLEISEIIKWETGKEELALMALGWLCGEGHILMGRAQDGKFFAELRERSGSINRRLYDKETGINAQEGCPSANQGLA